MELKDVILSTLAEMEDIKSINNDSSLNKKIKKTTKENIANKPKLKTKLQKNELTSEIILKNEDGQSIDSELHFLTSMKERMLVLFEGFQAPNNTNIEAKIDMTLNFLEYILVTIDIRLKELEEGKA
ncbi:MAG: hypothetical protein L3J10_00125 [Sulfurimonas sp.]|nr:hypothetical protein [Sulfurimonas sp.]